MKFRHTKISPQGWIHVVEMLFADNPDTEMATEKLHFAVKLGGLPADGSLSEIEEEVLRHMRKLLDAEIPRNRHDPGPAS